MRAKPSLVLRATALTGAVAALCLAYNPGEARAQAIMTTIPPLALQIAGEAYCNAPTAIPALIGNGGYNVVSSKGSAILGRAPSQLELIRMQQAGIATPLASEVPARAGINMLDESAAKPLRPAAGGSLSRPHACGAVSSRSPAAAPFAQGTAPFRGTTGPGRVERSPDDFLASKRIAIGRTNFDNDWSRVRFQPVSAGQLRKFGGEQQVDRLSLIGAVNSAVNRKIRYVEDRQLFGKADYWAGARTTDRPPPSGPRGLLVH